MFRRIAVLLPMLLLGNLISAGAARAAAHLSDDEAVQDLRAYYIQDDLDLTAYDKVLIDTLTVDDARVVPPPWVEGSARSAERWRLTQKDIQWLRESYRSAMRAMLGGPAGASSAGYPIVMEAGVGVLIVDIEIVALMPYARKDESVTTRGFGEILVQAQFRDGATQQLLAVFEGWQNVGSEYQQNSRLNSERDLQELFTIWGQRVRRILDERRG